RVFIATAEARDEEMRARIRAHQEERQAGFETLEAPRDLAHAVQQNHHAHVLLIDCLTLWLSNLLLDDLSDQAIDDATTAWLDAVADHPGNVIVVANEVGQGIVPDNALSRRFRDLAGRLNQRVAQCADLVEIRFFGLGVKLKDLSAAAGGSTRFATARRR